MHKRDDQIDPLQKVRDLMDVLSREFASGSVLEWRVSAAALVTLVSLPDYASLPEMMSIGIRAGLPADCVGRINGSWIILDKSLADGFLEVVAKLDYEARFLIDLNSTDPARKTEAL